MVVSDAIHNIMGGMESTAGVRLHNHRRKLKQRFDIIKKLGQGTYGKVQLGINKETGQEVAIKTIKKSKIETEADLIRIRREIQIMSSVQHPNIIHIYEVFENREKMVLVMEYAAGGELYDYLSERKVLIESEARRIFRQISTAVYYCHKHNICHRDLKLENILLDEHGSAKIADFGLSNVFDAHNLLGTFCGSPLYASPEIVKGTPYRGPEVDCWSLGVLLYTLVYGAMPFDGSNFKRLVKQISHGDYFEPKKPSPASALIRDMLLVSPEERADIVKICSHWWMNEGQSHTCIELAEELANQTPVRLDLLLSLAPPVGAEGAAAAKEGVGDGGQAPAPTRSQSVGSLAELDRPRTFDRRASGAGQEDTKDSTKRKLEQLSSTEEASSTGAKRKERSRRRERSSERSSERKHRSSSSSKTPKPAETPTKPSESPVPKPVESSSAEPVKTADAAVASKEDAADVKTLVQAVESRVDEPMDVDVATSVKDGKLEEVTKVTEDSPAEKVEDALPEVVKPVEEEKKVKVKKKKKTSDLKDEPKAEEAPKTIEDVSKADSNAVEAATTDVIVESSQKSDVVETVSEEIAKPAEEAKPKVVKKTGAIKKKLDTTAAKVEEAAPPVKPMARRRSKLFDSEIQKFNSLSTTELKSPTVEKPKKVFIPGVKVSDFKKAYERKSSVDLSTATNESNAVKTSPSKKAVGEKKLLIKDIDSDQSLSETSSTLTDVSKTTDGKKESSPEKVKSIKTKPEASPEKTKKPVSAKPVEASEESKPVEKVPVAAKPAEKASLPAKPVEKTSPTTVKPVEKVPATAEAAKATVDKPVAKPVDMVEKPVDKVPGKPDAAETGDKTQEEAIKKKKTAIEIIGNAIAKPPKPLLEKLKTKPSTAKSQSEIAKKLSEEVTTPKSSPSPSKDAPMSPKPASGPMSPLSPLSPTGKKFVKIQVGPNDVRNATLLVSTPEQIKNFQYNENATAVETPNAGDKENTAQNAEETEPEKPSDKKVSSKVEITLKSSSTLPRRKTSKAEIQLGAPRPEYRTEVAHMVGGAGRLRNQRSEVAFPVAAAAQPLANRSLSVEPDGAAKNPPRERIIPIRFESDPEQPRPPPPSKPPAGPLQQQRSLQSQRSNSLSRQSTLESDTESSAGEPIKKSPREFIIPIAVEGGGYVTPRAGSLEPGSDIKPERSAHRPMRFNKPMRMSSLLSDGGASDDEGFNSLSSPFSSLNRHSDGGALEDEFGAHMHRLRSSRPSRTGTDKADSASDEDDEDDDDGLELLTAESLFSTLLSRVRNLTQRLNVDDGGRPAFPASRFMNHNFPSHSAFFNNHMEPLSRRVSETTQFGRDPRRSASRDASEAGDASASSSRDTLPRANVVRVTVHVPRTVRQ